MGAKTEGLSYPADTDEPCGPFPANAQHHKPLTIRQTLGMLFHRFDPEGYYRANDPALGVIATYGTLAHWRCHGAGPRYTRFGHRVLYRGADLNAWLDAHVVEAQQPPARG